MTTGEDVTERRVNGFKLMHFLRVYITTGLIERVVLTRNHAAELKVQRRDGHTLYVARFLNDRVGTLEDTHKEFCTVPDERLA